MTRDCVHLLLWPALLRSASTGSLDPKARGRCPCRAWVPWPGWSEPLHRMRGDGQRDAQRSGLSSRTLLSQAGCGARGNQALGACFLPAGSSEERSNCRQSPQSRAWLAGVWKQWVCFLFNRLRLGAWGRACQGASATAGISRQPAGPPTRVGPPLNLHVVTGSNPPMGPAAPLVALNHMPRAPFVSVSFAQV